MPMSTKRRAPAKLAAPIVQSSAKRAAKNTIDESRTTVAGTDALQSSQVETIEISSDPDSDEDMSEEESEEVAQSNGIGAETTKGGEPLALVNGKQNPKKAETEDAESDGEEASPSFGELLRGTEVIDVNALLQQSSTDGNALTRTAQITAPPRHQTLTTVLTQALKSDDTDLLESCLHTTDIAAIRNTIERLDSSLAITLLSKLAARLYRRPGRSGTLMTWVQWTLIAHGGALASQPKVLHQLNSLQKVLAERAKGLNSLLALKGKLDILEGQMELRRKMQRSSGLLEQGDEEDEDVIYVEGEEDDAAAAAKDIPNGIRSKRRRSGAAATEDDDSADEVVTNGFIGDSEDEEEISADEEEDSEDAEEALDEDEVDYDDVDESMGEDDESDVEVAPPAKVQKVASKAFGKKK